MKLRGVFITAVATIILTGISTTRSEASSFSFGYSGPGVSIHIGRYPHYNYAPYYYRPHHYRPYVYRPYRPYSSRCGYWSQRCAANWGYGNNNYYGCLRYHGCR